MRFTLEKHLENTWKNDPEKRCEPCSTLYARQYFVQLKCPAASTTTCTMKDVLFILDTRSIVRYIKHPIFISRPIGFLHRV